MDAIMVGSDLLNIHGTVKSTDLENGTRIVQRNGWYGTLKDGQKRHNTRVAEVEGFYTEMGSIYVHDILAAQIDGKWYRVEHTKKQNELREQVANFF